MINAYAKVYVGAELSPKEVMDRFGATYDDKIRGTCPKDHTPNPDRRNFCGNCGTNLKYRKKVAEGIEDLDEVEDLEAVKRLGLDAYALREDSEGKEGVIIGKKLADSSDINESGSVTPLEDNVAQTFSDVQKRLSELGVNQPVRMYLITTVI